MFVCFSKQFSEEYVRIQVASTQCPCKKNIQKIGLIINYNGIIIIRLLADFAVLKTDLNEF
jgi:hypothetical protein